MKGPRSLSRQISERLGQDRQTEEDARDSFYALAERLQAEARPDETLFSELTAERSDFARLNQNRIRQAGQIRHASLQLRLIDGNRQAEAACDLSGDLAHDFELARGLLRQLRLRLRHLPDDPYLHVSDEPTRSDRWPEVPEVDAAAAVADIIAAGAVAGAGAGAGLDLVGIWASGEVTAGLASSLGHRHWHVSRNFHFDWSCHGDGDQSVKGSLGGLRWDAAPVRARLDAMRAELDILARPPKVLAPGRYRAWLAPMAVSELTDMLAWDGFDLKSQRTRQTPLLRLLDGEEQFDPRVSLREVHGPAGTGLLPAFTSEGFMRPDSVTLIDRGAAGSPLVDARAGKEYGLAVNAASGYPESLAMEPGDLAPEQVLEALGTGLFIGNLWYCNWSDPNYCRVTGMTRFGTYWVEDGVIVAPVAPMRFDDSLYRLLGERLVAIGAEAQLLLSAQTYGGRSLESARLPGLLVAGMDFAL
ncbi:MULTISPECIES: metallopeptidase TldD-related protein [Thiorhodovibrio]|uniref:metallopeptidase TldD-related protein n=1 Tax=Thiorhodovibrio TaxID=61593 RepID=UPI0019135826|nr:MULTISPECIES: metallopeptidase TldD-related protein [Thiorhodovibrio]MBK5969895.1 peptidase [Thiorhodovibrio winogradskyi]WPL12060.1 Zn-dependent protease [Thiorhodovibrio litoralis]